MTLNLFLNLFREAGIIHADDLVVCNLTGHGLKQPEAIRLTENELTPIAPSLVALRERMQSMQGSETVLLPPWFAD